MPGEYSMGKLHTDTFQFVEDPRRPLCVNGMLAMVQVIGPVDLGEGYKWFLSVATYDYMISV
jgi:hypothetical protein